MYFLGGYDQSPRFYLHLVSQQRPFRISGPKKKKKKRSTEDHTRSDAQGIDGDSKPPIALSLFYVDGRDGRKSPTPKACTGRREFQELKSVFLKKGT